MTDEDRSDEISEDERRQFYRSRLIVDVHFDGADSTGIASTKDISRGGLYLSTQAGIPVGAMLTLRIPLGGSHLVVKGMWSTTFRAMEWVSGSTVCWTRCAP